MSKKASVAAAPTVVTDELYALLERDPTAAILQTSLAEDAAAHLDDTSEKRMAVEPEIVGILLAGFRASVEQYISSELLEAHPDLQDMKESILQGRRKVRGDIMRLLREHGGHLRSASREQSRFNHEVTYEPGKDVEPTLANFRHLRGLHKDIEARRDEMAATLGGAQRSLRANIPGMAAFSRLIVQTEGGSEEHRLKTLMRQMWGDERVQAEWVRAQHVAYAQAAERGDRIIEGPSTVVLLNRIHREINVNKMRGSTGVALVGPPGWGKTEILKHYFAEVGIHLVTADMSRISNAATLMARPALQDESFRSLDDVIDAIETMTHRDFLRFYTQHPELCQQAGIDWDQIKNPRATQRLANARQALAAPLKDARGNRIAEALQTHVRQRGVVFGLLAKTLLRPNSAFGFEEFTYLDIANAPFVNGLMTTIPATDEEAGLPPDERTTPGDLKGWFQEPISGIWFRVPKTFSINGTANVGAAYRNQGISAAWESRFGGGLITIPLRDQRKKETAPIDDGVEFQETPEGNQFKEYLETLVWPRLSDSTTGRFELDDDTAYRLDFLVRRVLPHIISTLRRRNRKMPNLSIRTLQDLCNRLLPRSQDEDLKGVNLDTAIWESIVEPLAADIDQYGETVEVVLAWLMGSGVLRNVGTRVKGLLSGPVHQRLQKTIDQLRTSGSGNTEQAAETFEQFQDTQYTRAEGVHAGSCHACGVTACPVHGKDTEEYLHQLAQLERAAAMGMTPEIARAISKRQAELLRAQEWGMLLEVYLETNGAKQLEKIPAGLEEYLQSLVTACTEDPEQAPEHIQILQRASANALPVKVDQQWMCTMMDYWGKVLANTEFVDVHERLKQLQDVPGASAEQDRVRIGKDMQRIVRDRIAPALRVMRTLQEWSKQTRDLNMDECMVLTDMVDYLPAQSLMVARELTAEEEHKDVVKTAVDRSVKSRKKELQAEFKAMRDNLGGGANQEAAQGRVIARPPAEIAQMPQLVQQYGAVQRLLREAGALAKLHAIPTEELTELVSLASGLLREGFGGEKESDVCIPFVRCMRTIADVRGMSVNDVLQYFFEPKVVPYPPIRQF